MSSLFKMILETMPGEGALTMAATDRLTTEGATSIGGLAMHMEYVDDADVLSLGVASPELSAKDVKNGQEYDKEARKLPIWSYACGPSLHEVSQLTCRVRDEGYREYVVLDKVAFGSSPFGDPSQFDPCVRVVTSETMGPMRTLELPLTEPFRVATFKTRGGWLRSSSLWPVSGHEDVGFIHVFVFDYNIFCDTVEPVSARELGDPDLDELAKFRGAAQRLVPGGEYAWDPLTDLFHDNLFEPMGESVAGSITDVLLSGAGSLVEIALAATAIRFVVICTMSLWKEGTTYSPGGAGGAARIFPHILTKSTIPLSAVLATVQMQRPTKTTIVGGGSCSCSEMREEIRPLLVADADAANAQDIMPPLSPGPAPFWNSLFNYYYAVDSPSDVFFQTPIRAVCAEKVSRDTAANPDGPALIERKRWRNKDRVTRTVCQGEFDNIHLAPRMSLKDVAFVKSEALDQTLILLNDSDRAKWNLDSIPMAPFCVHDCFHMHWRWADFADYEQFGYTPFWAMSERALRPGTTPGATMIPPNQSLWLWLTNASGFNYAAAALFVAPDEWQIFCHHGAGYAVHTGSAMNLARNLEVLNGALATQGVFSDIPDGYAATGDASNVTLVDSNGKEIDPSDSWAAFYWHIHYFFDGSDVVADIPKERVIIHNLSALRAF